MRRLSCMLKKPHHVELILRNLFSPVVFLFMLLIFNTADARLLVSVTVPAQAWLVEQIAGEDVDILIMVPDGHVPETAQPGTRDLSRFQQADLRFIVGHPLLYFETRYIRPFQPRAGEPEDDSEQWVSMFEIARQLKPQEKLQATDPHLWTSPAIMLAAAERLVKVLGSLQPEHAEKYRNNLIKLEVAIQQLDNQLRTAIKHRQSAELLVYHPAWGHFTNEYGLHQLAIEDEGKAPAAGGLTRLYADLQNKDIRFIVCSPGHDQRVAGMIAEQLQMTVVLINPMQHDWMYMMQQMKSLLEKNSNNE